MKKLLRSAASITLLFSSSFAVNAQTATELKFSNPKSLVEFGFSVVEHNGYSVFGSEFRDGINVFHNGNFLFQAHGPLRSNFGHSVGINSNWLAAGAYQSGTEVQGAVFLSKHVNGQPKDNFNIKISALSPRPYDQFGKAIDLHGDWMVIGAPNVNRDQHGGYVEIWKHTNGTWVRNRVIRPILPVNADFGFSVAIRNDRMVIGAPGINKIYIYKNINNNWTLEQTFSPNRNTWATVYDFGTYKEYSWKFGHDVDITDGHIIVGDPHARKAGIISFQNNYWSLTHTLTPPTSVLNTGDKYGQSVAIQFNRAVVGAPRPAGSGPTQQQGEVYMYTDGYKFKGTMYVGYPSHLEILALGYDVSIDSDIVLAGASNTNNLNSRRNEGAAFRMPFRYVYQSGNYRLEETAESSNKTKTTLYPNPAKEDYITYIVNGESIISAEAVAITGEVIPLTHNGNIIKISDLNKGIYLLKVITESGVKKEKLIKE